MTFGGRKGSGVLLPHSNPPLTLPPPPPQVLSQSSKCGQLISALPISIEGFQKLITVLENLHKQVDYNSVREYKQKSKKKDEERLPLILCDQSHPLLPVKDLLCMFLTVKLLF